MNSTDNSITRESLIRIVNLVKPALSTQDYIPALKHILFAAGFASAFNDNQAIQVRLPSSDLDLGLCLPGDMLAKALASFNAEKVMLAANEKDSSLAISSGRAKIKTKTMPASSFPLELPKGKGVVIEVTDDMLEGIRRCLIGVGNNPTHPASMGVTLDSEGQRAILYSTDNATISRYKTKTVCELPGDSPVVIPTFFCEQLVSLAKAFPKTEVDLRVYPGALVAEYNDPDADTNSLMARLFTKTLDDITALDYGKIVAKHLDIAKAAAKMATIPASFDAAFDRALLVLGASTDKATKITPTDSGLKLLSLSDLGEAQDSINFDGKEGADALDVDEPFYVDPTLIARGCKSCATVGFFTRVVVFGDADGRFLHLVSHCSAS